MTVTENTTITDIRTVAVRVADQDAAADFYVDTLGFEIRRDVLATPTMRWIEVAAPGAVVSVALIAGEPTESFDTGIRFAVPNARREHARLAGRGVAVSEVLQWDGVPEMFSFEDPDGNRYVIGEDGR